MQDTLKFFSFSQADGTRETHLQAVLRKSYDFLPTDQHRRMFLDAALMLRGCPVEHLIAVWEGALLLDSQENGLGLLPSRSRDETYAAWQTRRCDVAANSARKLLNDLCEHSLVQCSLGADWLSR